MLNKEIDFDAVPSPQGHFGIYGGKFVAETLMHALNELEEIYYKLKDDAEFCASFDNDLAHYVGRPSPYILLSD